MLKSLVLSSMLLSTLSLCHYLNRQMLISAFLYFEKVAGKLKWPKEYWVMLLQSVLVGKFREIYSQLIVEQAPNYDNVK